MGGGLTLSLHGTDAGLHPHHPFDHLPVLVGVVGKGDGVLLVVLLAEIELNCGTFKDAFGFAAGLVDDGRDTAVGCDVIVS